MKIRQKRKENGKGEISREIMQREGNKAKRQEGREGSLGSVSGGGHNPHPTTSAQPLEQGRLQLLKTNLCLFGVELSSS